MLENPGRRESLGQLTEMNLTLDPQDTISNLKNTFGTFLKRNRVFIPTNLYRFIPSENRSRDVLVTQGTDHPEFDGIFAFSHSAIFTKHSLLPKEYLFNYIEQGCTYTCMVALYDGTQFIDDDCHHHYTFRNPDNKLDALKAVVYVSPVNR